MGTKTKDNRPDGWSDFVEEAKAAGRGHQLRLSVDKFQQAYDLSRTFPEGDRRRADSAYYLGYARYLNRERIEAIPLLEEAAVGMAPDPLQQARCAQIHSLLATLHFGSKNLEQAEVHAKEAIEIESQLQQESWEPIQLLGSVLVSLGKYSEAVPVLEKLVEVQKRILPQEVPKTLTILAFVYKQVGNSKAELQAQKLNFGARDKLKQKDRPKAIELAQEPPERWGSDPISDFLEAATQAGYASFHNEKKVYEQLLDIQKAFDSARINLTIHLKDVIDSKPKQTFEQIKLNPDDWLELYFFMRAHASLLAAIRLGMSGQSPETFAVLRACLENALYAFYLASDSALKSVWLQRHADDPSYQLCRDTFQVGKIEKQLAKADKKLKEQVHKLYHLTIDEGAHPNVKAFLANSAQVNARGELTVAVAYINPDEIDKALRSTIEVGMAVLDVFRLIFPKLID